MTETSVGLRIHYPNSTNPEFVRAYDEHPGDYTPREAYQLAVQRDEEASAAFLASVAQG